jgi:hypothetical protein
MESAMQREMAEISLDGEEIVIRTPYNPALVVEIRGIPGRWWDARKRVWHVPASSEQQVREIIRQFYQIEGEPCYIPYKVVRVRVRGGKYAGVCINGRELFDLLSGYLDMSQPNDIFEILDYAGGFTDEYKRVQDRHETFRVDYTLRLNVREDAVWLATGYGDNKASYEFISPGNSSIDQFLEELNERGGL